jgi:hypothetical protein
MSVVDSRYNKRNERNQLSTSVTITIMDREGNIKKEISST